MKLGFETQEEYDDFCKYLIELYKDNPKMSLNDVCIYVQEEHGIKLYKQKLYNIFKEYKVDTAPSGIQKKKHRTRQLRMTVDFDDWRFVNDLKERFEGVYMKREFSKFCLHLARGKPSKHLILWLSELKPIVILYDPKLLQYNVIGEDLSDLELSILEDLLAEVEETNSLNPIKAYAKERGLLFWGDNKSKYKPS